MEKGSYRHHKRISPSLEQRIVDLYNSGLTFEQVAEEAKVSRDTAMRAFKRMGGVSRGSNWNRKGIKNGRWKTGYRLSSGYIRVYVPDEHRFASFRATDRSIMQHRLVMMEHLNRPLSDGETVHHINGNKKDNRIENLQLIFGNHGSGIALCCADCGSININPVEKGAM